MGGTEFEDSRNPQIPGNFLVEGATAGFPLEVSDVLPEWQDEFSLQDLNADGTITLAESQETFFRGNIAFSNSPSTTASRARSGSERRSGSDR